MPDHGLNSLLNLDINNTTPELHQAILDSIPSPLILIDLTAVIRSSNLAARGLFKSVKKNPTLIGESIFDRLADRADAIATIEKSLDDQAVRTCEISPGPGGGKNGLFRLSISPIISENDAFLGLSLCFEDAGRTAEREKALVDKIRTAIGLIEKYKIRLYLAESLIKSIGVPMLTFDSNGLVSHINEQAAALLEHDSPPAAFVNQEPSLFFGRERELADMISDRLYKGDRIDGLERTITGMKGGRKDLRLRLFPFKGPNETRGGAVLLLLEKSSQSPPPPEIVIQDEIQLQPDHSLEKPSQTLVMGVNHKGEAASLNPSVKKTLVRLGASMEDFLPENHLEIVTACLRSGQARENVKRSVRGRSYIWTYNPLPSHNMVQIKIIDVTERKRMEESSQEDAFHDSLTGLPNRALFIDRLERAIAHAKRRPDSNFAVLFLDMDRFKFVNDSLGHNVGDIFLREMSNRMLSVLRSCDTLARVGGDEFVALLDSVEDANGALYAAERIQKMLSKPFKVEGYELYTTASIGIVLDNGSYSSADEILRDADTAMHRAKGAGKARSEIFDSEMHKSALKRLETEMDLKRTVGRDEFRVFYQPIISLKTGRIAGFEALVRWFHPIRGIVNPAEFIPLAEETGLIVSMGSYVLYEACRQSTAWTAKYPRLKNMMMSVNLSVRQFASPSLLDDIRQILAWSEWPPNQLKLEITESGVMEDANASLKILNELREMDVRLSIDDFGTGYSSLSYLHRFPFDYLKVDQSFVKRMERGGENMKIVNTIVSLAHDMEKEVIAEGIENEKQLEILRKLGCEYGQGYLIAKPLPKKEAEGLLKKDLKW